MTNSNNDIEELEELLTELEGQEAQIVTPYSEEDDAVTRLMDAPLGDQDWMVQVTALDRRMMSTSQLLTELQTGKVNGRTLVWRTGMDDWMPVSRIDELSRASAAPVAAPQRGAAGAHSSQRAGYPNLAPPPPPSQPLWSNGPSAPLPPPPTPMSPPFGMAHGAGLPPPPLALQPPPPIALTPPPPAPSAGYGSSSAAPLSAPPSEPMSHGNTTRPVAVDFSDMPPENDAPLQSKRWVMALSAVAIMAVFVTVYSLSSGGGESDSKQAVATAAKPTVSSLQPSSSSAKDAPAREKSASSAAAAPSAKASAAKSEAAPSEASAKANDDDESEASSSATARQTAPARYSMRSEYRRRSRGSSSSSDESSRSNDAEEPTKAAAAAVAPSSAARAAEDDDAANEPVAAVADEVDDPPKSTAKSPGNTFNREAAKAALDEAAGQAKNCRPQGGPSGTGQVQVRYEPSGKVANVTILTSKFDNTTAGSCVRMLFRRAKVPEFTGAPVVVVNKSFEIP